MNTYKRIEQEQTALIVDKVSQLEQPIIPKVGWIKILRMALSMSGAALARRLSLQRSSVAYLEQAEINGSISLKKLKQVANAMDCELVYALVPKSTADNPNPLIADILQTQAHNKAVDIVKRASSQMHMEQQGLNDKDLTKEVARMSKQLLDKMPNDFWDA